MAAISLKKLRQTFEIVDTDPDHGLFHVVSKAINMQGGLISSEVGKIRDNLAGFLLANRGCFESFVDGDFVEYTSWVKAGRWQGELEIEALQRMLGYVIEIYDLQDPSEDVIRYTYEHRPSTKTIRLLRMKGSEYYVLQRKCSFSSDCDWRMFCKDDRCVSRD